MIVAGIDGATTTGFAVLDGPRLVHWQAFRPDGKEDPEIFRGFRIWLRTALVTNHVEVVAYEQPLRTNFGDCGGDDEQGAFGGFRRVKNKPQVNMKTFLRLYGIRAHAIEILHSLNIEHVEVNNVTWRSGIYKGYGAGRPPVTVAADARSKWWKDKALKHCLDVMKWDISSPDAAEAALIAEWMRCQLNPRLAGHADDLFRAAR